MGSEAWIDSGKDVLLIGGGGHCKSVINAMLNTEYNPAAILDKNPCLDRILGIPVEGDDALLPTLRSRFKLALVTVGQIKNYTIRKNIFEKIKELGYEVPVVLAKSACVSPWSEIGAGTVVLNFAMINANVNIGNNTIINTGAIIEHDAKIGNNCHISTGAIINGGAIIEDNVFVGSGSIVREMTKIGHGSIIGMGSLVKKDIAPHSILRNEASPKIS